MKAENSLPNIGVGVYVYNKAGKILLGRRKNSHGENSWSCPGGKLNTMESLKECAHRELHEETGLEIEKIEFLGYTEDFFENENLHFITFAFKVLPKTEDPILKEPHKCSGWEWFDLANLPSPLFLPIQNLFKKLELISENISG